MPSNNTSPRATIWEKIGYGFGDMSSSMFWKIFSYYLPFFYSNVFGLSLTHAGTLLLITKLYDAVSDPVMGTIADRTDTRWGKYRSYLLWCAIPFAICGVLSFTTPATGYAFKHVYAYISYLLMMTAYTAINVPYGAMLGVLTPDSREKTVFSSYRMFFAYGGSFIALALFEPLQKFFKGVGANVSLQASWQYSMVVIGLMCAVMFILCFLMTKERVKLPAVAKDGSSVKDDLKHLVTNWPWWILLIAAIGVLLFNSIRGGVAAYYFKDVVGTSALFTCGSYLAVGEIANMAGVALAVPLSDRIGKKNSYLLALIVSAVLSLFIAFIPMTRTGLWMLLGLQVVICIATGVTFPLLWSMFADIADYSELKYGSASTGLIFSSSSMAQKFGGAFGSALILWVLAAFNYDTGEAAVQSATAITGLKAMMSYIPSIGALLAIVIMLFYTLTDKKMKEISAGLSSKRSE
ncbi:MAG: MFS transporter [Bacteroidales bacterium]|nr:MFS transporter [Bacteroidales bacterium]